MGTHVLPRLIERGHHVRAVVRSDHEAARIRVERRLQPNLTLRRLTAAEDHVPHHMPQLHGERPLGGGKDAPEVPQLAGRELGRNVGDPVLQLRPVGERPELGPEGTVPREEPHGIGFGSPAARCRARVRRACSEPSAWTTRGSAEAPVCAPPLALSRSTPPPRQRHPAPAGRHG